MNVYACLCGPSSVSEYGPHLWCGFHSQISLYRKITCYVTYLGSQSKISKTEFELSTIARGIWVRCCEDYADQLGCVICMREKKWLVKAKNYGPVFKCHFLFLEKYSIKHLRYNQDQVSK